MKCDRFHDLLDAYRRNELPPETVSEVEKHLQDCESCAVYADETDRLGQILRSATPAEPAPAYFEDLARRVRRQVERPARARILDIGSWIPSLSKPRALAWAAAAALVSIGAFSLLLSTENRRESAALQTGYKMVSQQAAKPDSLARLAEDRKALRKQKTEIASAGESELKAGTFVVTQAAPASQITNAPVGSAGENRGAPVHDADRQADAKRQLASGQYRADEAKVPDVKAAASSATPPVSQPVASPMYDALVTPASRELVVASPTQPGSSDRVLADALETRSLDKDRRMKPADKEWSMVSKKAEDARPPALAAGRELAAAAAPSAPSGGMREEQVRQRQAASPPAAAPPVFGAVAAGGSVSRSVPASSSVVARRKQQEVTTSTASALFLDAEDARLSGRYEDAIALYRRVAGEAPATSLAARAMLRIADVTFENLHNNQSARRAYENCLAESFRPFFSQDELQAIRARLDQLRPQP